MPKATQERSCIITGETLPKDQLLRFVIDPEGYAVPDLKGNLPGRGMWLKPERSVLELACKKNAFSRSAKTPVKTRDKLIEKTDELLLQRCLNYLNRARQAGYLLTGFEKVSAELQKGSVYVLIHASDASEDGCRKLDKLANASFEDETDHRQVKILNFVNRDSLAECLHTPNPVHIAIISSDLSAIFMASYERWARFNEKDAL